MKILHCISELQHDDLVSDSVRLMVASLNDRDEARIVTAKDNWKATVAEWKPDIVHIHVCWSHAAARCVSTFVRNGQAVVCSPHGALDDYPRKKEQPIAKRLKTWAYQKHAFHCADALLTSSEKEYLMVQSLGWNNRMDWVASPIYDTTLPPHQFGDSLTAFYQKIIDTRYRKQMTSTEKAAACTLLRVGTSQGSFRTLVSSEQILTLRSLTPLQWKRIMLYADDEDVSHLIRRGAALMQLDLPAIDSKAIVRFPQDCPKSAGPLEECTDGFNTANLKRQQQAWSNDGETLSRLCTMLVLADWHISQKTFSMRHLTELYQAFRFGDYDEDRFRQVASQAGLTTLTGRLLHVLQETLELEEGFMPMSARKDRKATHIRKLVI